MLVVSGQQRPRSHKQSIEAHSAIVGHVSVPRYLRFKYRVDGSRERSDKITTLLKNRNCGPTRSQGHSNEIPWKLGGRYLRLIL